MNQAILTELRQRFETLYGERLVQMVLFSGRLPKEFHRYLIEGEGKEE